MLDHEDLKWIATTSTELNSMLQQISRYADLARQHKGEFNYIELLGERVELATKTAQSLFDHVTSRILEGSASRTIPREPTFTVVRKEDSARPSGRASAKGTGKTRAAASEIPSEIKVINRKGKRELILIVEDEVEIAQLAAEMLAEEGYRVVIAHDGFEALRIYQQIGNQIGLIILDFFLPVMDGDAVFDELRTINPNAVVVLSSGFAEQSKLGNMLAQGLRGFIPKPYAREKLLAQVRSTLDAAKR